jgi:hypothetical protein
MRAGRRPHAGAKSPAWPGPRVARCLIEKARQLQTRCERFGITQERIACELASMVANAGARITGGRLLRSGQVTFRARWREGSPTPAAPPVLRARYAPLAARAAVIAGKEYPTPGSPEAQASGRLGECHQRAARFRRWDRGVPGVGVLGDPPLDRRCRGRSCDRSPRLVCLRASCRSATSALASPPPHRSGGESLRPSETARRPSRLVASEIRASAPSRRPRTDPRT